MAATSVTSNFASFLSAPVSGATTRELIALYDIAATLEDVLMGLQHAPRCTGPVQMWTETLAHHLHETQNLMAVALLQRDDENQMRSVALARHLEWAFETNEEAAILRALKEVANRVKAAA